MQRSPDSVRQGEPVATDPLRLLVLGLLVLATLPLVGAVIDIGSQWPDLAAKDWTALREVGVRLVAGEWDRLYEDQPVDPAGKEIMLFLYPPFVAWMLAPLALLPPAWAWVTVAAVQLGATAAALALLRSMLPALRHPGLVALAVVASAPFTHVLVIGQNSGLLALAGVLATALFLAGRPTAAGAVLGLLACKPNWLPGFLLFAARQGGWRAILGLVATAGALGAASAPLGGSAWTDYLAMMERSRSIVTGIPGFKKIALRSALESAGLQGGALEATWLGCALVLGACLVVALLLEPSVPRRLGAVVLFTVSANLYLNFYDALVLFVPAVIWWGTREGWTPWAWRLAGACLAFVFTWDHFVFYSRLWIGDAVDALPGWPPGSVLGAPVAIWLMADAADVLTRARREGRLANAFRSITRG